MERVTQYIKAIRRFFTTTIPPKVDVVVMPSSLKGRFCGSFNEIFVTDISKPEGLFWVDICFWQILSALSFEEIRSTAGPLKLT